MYDNDVNAEDSQEGCEAPTSADHARLVAQAIERWPNLGLDRRRFEAYLDQRLQGVELGSLRVSDLYLACACAEGLPRAIEAFEAEFERDIAMALRRVEVRGLQPDDLRQAVREKIFVGAPGALPKICEYNGRGMLRNWLRVTVLRMRIDAERRTKARAEQPHDEQALDQAALTVLSNDPELSHMKAHYRRALYESLREAFQSLAARERHLLRQHLELGLGTAKLAALYGVHRATLKRWLASTRSQLLETTRHNMRTRVGVAPDEFDSLMRLIGSRLDMSMQQLLATGGLGE
jgi:RNA polymerase sigma-70 factor (ECF subfamily)